MILLLGTTETQRLGIKINSNLSDEGPLGPVGFGKRRRNLLVISVLLAAGLWVGISFDSLKEISILFFKFSPDRPEHIAHIAWIVWVYFLIRYIGLKQQFPIKLSSSLTNYFRAGIHSVYDTIIRSELLKQKKTPEGDYSMGILSVTILGTSCSIRMRKSTVATPWENIEPIKLSLSPTAIWRVRIKVLVKTLFWAVFTSEYYLPYLIALLPVVIAFWPKG